MCRLCVPQVMRRAKGVGGQGWPKRDGRRAGVAMRRRGETHLDGLSFSPLLVVGVHGPRKVPALSVGLAGLPLILLQRSFVNTTRKVPAGRVKSTRVKQRLHEAESEWGRREARVQPSRVRVGRRLRHNFEEG